MRVAVQRDRRLLMLDAYISHRREIPRGLGTYARPHQCRLAVSAGARVSRVADFG